MPDFNTTVRMALNYDLPAIVKIEKATFGEWDEKWFARILNLKRVACWVAATTKVGDTAYGEHITGFIVLEITDYEVKVINMAATWPDARRKLIAKAQQRAERRKMYLTWEEA